MDKLTLHGLYKIKNQYFSDFPRDNWYDNKNENRPYYYLISDKQGVNWVIPMSSQVDNYRLKIELIEKTRGEGKCIYYHIGKIMGKESVFLISDMFPIEESFIKEQYTIQGQHYVVKNEKLNQAIHSKAMRYLKLVETGRMTSRNDIMSIKRTIVNRNENKAFIL